MNQPRFVPIADQALLVEFGQTVNDETNLSVQMLDQALARTPPEGLIEVVPAFVNLVVVFDPTLTDHGAIQQEVLACLDERSEQIGNNTVRDVEICYDAELAPDLEEIARQAGMSTEAVINAHLAGDFHVVMYGFAPGYAYMAGVPEVLHLPRKTSAVRDVPEGSVLIAGPQCLVSTICMPTGWWRIGRSTTPVLTGDPQKPFLFDVGDPVRFKRIGRSEFDESRGGKPHG